MGISLKAMTQYLASIFDVPTGSIKVNVVADSSATTGSSFGNFAQGTPKQVSVPITNTQLLAANTARLYACISNNSANAIYIQYGSPAVVGQGIKLNTGAIWTISTQELFHGSINAISSIGTNLIDVTEGVQ